MSSVLYYLKNLEQLIIPYILGQIFIQDWPSLY